MSCLLHGRSRECARIHPVLAAARESTSGCLVIRGEPGIGRTALLTYAVEHAQDMRVLSASGVPSESQLAFAGLHQLLRPVLARLADIAEPQADALRSAGSGSRQHWRRGLGRFPTWAPAAGPEAFPVLELLALRHSPEYHPTVGLLSVGDAGRWRSVQQAGGASNKDVAAQLFLSPRTVDYHLRNVFMKLGIAPHARNSSAIRSYATLPT